MMKDPIIQIIEGYEEDIIRAYHQGRYSDAWRLETAFDQYQYRRGCLPKDKIRHQRPEYFPYCENSVTGEFIMRHVRDIARTEHISIGAALERFCESNPTLYCIYTDEMADVFRNVKPNPLSENADNIIELNLE